MGNLVILDWKGPGAKAFTVIFLGPSSFASILVIWWTAALEAEYE